MPDDAVELYSNESRLRYVPNQVSRWGPGQNKLGELYDGSYVILEEMSTGIRVRGVVTGLPVADVFVVRPDTTHPEWNRLRERLGDSIGTHDYQIARDQVLDHLPPANMRPEGSSFEEWKIFSR